MLSCGLVTSFGIHVISLSNSLLSTQIKLHHLVYLSILLFIRYLFLFIHAFNILYL